MGAVRASSARDGGAAPGRRRWRRPLLAVASTALSLALLEGGSYLFGTFSGPLQPLRVGAIQLYGRHDPLLFWSLEPGARDADGRRWINDAGLRGPEVGAKQPGEYRILSLGESTTFAAQLPYADSYSAVLETLFDGGARRVRVLNAGVPGYSLFQGVVYLRERSARVAPDMALLYFGYNDFLPVAYLAERIGDPDEAAAGRNDWEVFADRQRPLPRAMSFLYRYSNVARGLGRLVADRDAPRARTNPARPRVPPAHREALLRSAKEYADARGIALVVVAPIYREFDRHVALLRRFTAEHGVPFVDLPAALIAEFAADPDAYFLDAVHPSRRGHRRIAEAIRDAIAPIVPD